MAISRAIVRDLFTSERSARIMNLIGIILGVGPAFAPTIGGVTLVVVRLARDLPVHGRLRRLRRAGRRARHARDGRADLSRIRPRALAGSYASFSPTGISCCTSAVVAGAIGALYAQATVLPFILMDRVGLTPTRSGSAC